MQSIHFVKLPPQQIFRLDDNLLPPVFTLINLNSVTDFQNFIVINIFFYLICTACRHVFLSSCMHNLATRWHSVTCYFPTPSFLLARTVCNSCWTTVTNKREQVQAMVCWHNVYSRVHLNNSFC